MPRAGLDTAAVVRAAAALADREGLDALTLARLAGELGVRSPSLYAHVEGLEDLHARIAADGAGQLADELTLAVAGRSGGAALRAFAEAYRAFALRRPGSYAALQRSALMKAPGAAAAAARLIEVVLAVLAGYGLEGEDALHATRALRAALHGFMSLEAGGGFGLELSRHESFERMIALVERGLRAHS